MTIPELHNLHFLLFEGLVLHAYITYHPHRTAPFTAVTTNQWSTSTNHSNIVSVFQYGSGSEHEQWLTKPPVLSIANTMYREKND